MKKLILIGIIALLTSFTTVSYEGGIAYCFGGGSNFTWSIKKMSPDIYQFTLIHAQEGAQMQVISREQAENICLNTPMGMQPDLGQQ